MSDLFTNEKNVDDFGVKYFGSENFNHLMCYLKYL